MMMRLTFALAGLAVVLGCDPAAACGRRKATARPAVVSCRPAPAHQAVVYSPPTYPPAAASPAAPTASPPAMAVEPRYEYDATTAGPDAYYYSYDESGKLIVRRWMDWVFRGGRDAGMARPPLPVVGWFTGR